MAFYGPEALEYAAEKAESEGNWRRAYGFWSDAISQYGNSVASDRLDYWKRHQEMCAIKMK